ncbi:MAG: hypothetical protein Q4C00_08685, partial [Bacillota bacterium]|nr:hypothetical protein [Bacillota bacterium]
MVIDLDKAVFCMLIFAAVNYIFLFLFGTYDKVWRYANVKDILRCVIALVCGGVISFVIWYFSSLPYSIVYFVMSFSVSMCVILGSRFFYLYKLNPSRNDDGSVVRKRTLIVGGGKACQMLLNEMFTISSCQYVPVGIADDDFSKIGRSINGVKVYGPIERIPDICRE